MRRDGLHVLAGRIGPALARSPRRRRLLFVLGLAPGMVLIMVLGPALRSAPLLLLGAVLAALAVAARAMTEPLFSAQAAVRAAAEIDPQEPHPPETV